ncbi:hypothetical protein ACWD4O_45100 [Streptomyces sp. NPDC002623]
MSTFSGVSGAAAAIESEEPRSPGYDAATKNDVEFNKEFRHCFTTIDDVQMTSVSASRTRWPPSTVSRWPGCFS